MTYKEANIRKRDLVHGAYYKGECRNATIARWDGINQCFVHYRTKWGEKFTETILHPEDELVFDVFVVERMLGDEEIKEEIPL